MSKHAACRSFCFFLFFFFFLSFIVLFLFVALQPGCIRIELCRLRSTVLRCSNETFVTPLLTNLLGIFVQLNNCKLIMIIMMLSWLQFKSSSMAKVFFTVAKGGLRCLCKSINLAVRLLNAA